MYVALIYNKRCSRPPILHRIELAYRLQCSQHQQICFYRNPFNTWVESDKHVFELERAYQNMLLYRKKKATNTIEENFEK